VTPNGELVEELAAGLDPQLESIAAVHTMAKDANGIPLDLRVGALNLDTVGQVKACGCHPPEPHPVRSWPHHP
jgi:hypothetical protein